MASNPKTIHWTGLVRVDENTTYGWLGDLQNTILPDINRTILTSMRITPTRTIFNITAGPVDLTVTFLSPIEVGLADLGSLVRP